MRAPLRLAALIAAACALALAGCGRGPVCEGFKGGKPASDDAAPPQAPAPQGEPAGR